MLNQQSNTHEGKLSVTKCIVCGAQSQRDRKFAERQSEVIFLDQCSGCHSQFLSPQPSDAWLTEEYSYYHLKRNGGLKNSKLGHFTQFIKQLNLDFSNSSVIDLGAAEGDCLRALHSVAPSARLTGLETSQDLGQGLSDLNCTWIPLSIEAWLEKGQKETSACEKYDFIFLLDVLEHLRDPLSVLKQITETRLNPKGLIIATFPNSDSLSKKLLGPLWSQYKVEHLTYFSGDSVNFMAKAAGLSTLRLEPMTKTLPVYYLRTVGSQFGPPLFQKITRGISYLIPPVVDRMSVSIKLGEWLWISQKI